MHNRNLFLSYSQVINQVFSDRLADGDTAPAPAGKDFSKYAGFEEPVAGSYNRGPGLFRNKLSQNLRHPGMGMDYLNILFFNYPGYLSAGKKNFRADLRFGLYIDCDMSSI